MSLFCRYPIQHQPSRCLSSTRCHGRTSDPEHEHLPNDFHQLFRPLVIFSWPHQELDSGPTARSGARNMRSAVVVDQSPSCDKSHCCGPTCCGNRNKPTANLPGESFIVKASHSQHILLTHMLRYHRIDTVPTCNLSLTQIEDP